MCSIMLVNNKPQMPVVCNVLLQGTPCQFHSPQHLSFEELKGHEVSILYSVKVARLDFLGGIPPKFEH